MTPEQCPAVQWTFSRKTGWVLGVLVIGVGWKKTLPAVIGEYLYRRSLCVKIPLPKFLQGEW